MNTYKDILNKNLIVQWEKDEPIWFNKTKGLGSFSDVFKFWNIFTGNHDTYYTSLDNYLEEINDFRGVELFMLTDADSIDELPKLHPELFI